MQVIYMYEYRDIYIYIYVDVCVRMKKGMERCYNLVRLLTVAHSRITKSCMHNRLFEDLLCKGAGMDERKLS